MKSFILITILSTSCQGSSGYGGGDSYSEDTNTQYSEETNTQNSDINETQQSTETATSSQTTADQSSSSNPPGSSPSGPSEALEDSPVLADAPKLNYQAKGSDRVTFSWEEPESHGTDITDYSIEYKPEGSESWLLFDDGVSVETSVTVSGLSPSTNYNFRVQTINSSAGPHSEILEVRTHDDAEFFDSNSFHLINAGGASSSRLVALEDDTTVTMADGITTVNLDRGNTHSFLSVSGDIISSDKPVFVAGRLASESTAAREANIVWSPPEWASHRFILNLERSRPHKIKIYMFAPGNVSMKQGSTEVKNISFGGNESKTFSLNTNGNFTVDADSSILIHVHSSGSNFMSYIDPRPILPPSNDILGFPSTKTKVTVDTDNIQINKYVADGSSDSIIGFKEVEIEHEGTGSGEGDSFFEEYKGYPTRYISIGGKMSAMSYSDGNGTCASVYLPSHLQKKKYAINVPASFVAFTSTEPATINIFGTDGSSDSLQLIKLGSDPKSPYYGRLTNQAEGTIYESDTRYAAWYQPNDDNDAAEDDETILFGFD